MQPGIEPKQARYERTDVTVRGALLLGGGVALLAVLGGGLAIVAFDVIERIQGASTAVSRFAGGAQRLPPEPRLQTDPPKDLQEMRARENEVLDGYTWIDRKRGIVRIPIDRAIDVLAERGLPARSNR